MPDSEELGNEINVGPYTGHVDHQFVEVWDAEAYLFKVPVHLAKGPLGERNMRVLASVYDLGVEVGRGQGRVEKAAEIRRALGL